MPTAPAPPPCAPPEAARGDAHDGRDRCRRWAARVAASSIPAAVAVGRRLATVLAMSIARSITDNNDLTSAGTMGVAIRTAAPIAMAGLGGLYAERSGTVNIGLEGMMILGTVFAGWWGWEYGPWDGAARRCVGGLFGGLLLALATTTFGVNHIVAGFAINILAPGSPGSCRPAVRRRAGRLADQARPASPATWASSRCRSCRVGRSSATTPDALGRIDAWNWFAVSDVAGVLRGSRRRALRRARRHRPVRRQRVPAVAHPFGLRLRSAGEHPSAADSLGVRVHLYRYIGAAISGRWPASAGRCWSSRPAATARARRSARASSVWPRWSSATGGRSASAIGASIFGFFDGITQRLSPADLVLALLLAAALLLFAGTVYAFVTKGVAATKFVAVGWSRSASSSCCGRSSTSSAAASS